MTLLYWEMKERVVNYVDIWNDNRMWLFCRWQYEVY